MRGLLVFTKSPEQIAFYSVDRELGYYIRRRYEERTDPLPDQEQSTAEDDTLRDSLIFFFLPLVGHFNTLQSLGKPLTSIYAGDNLLIVFNQFDNHVFVAVSDEKTESEEVLMRKLHAFNRILSTLYGQFKHKMTPPTLQQRKAEWQKLESLLKTYEMLYSQEPSFLVEAIEHIQFGQPNMAENVCITLAEDCLSSKNNGGISNVRHAMLLVGTKVLAMCGRSPQLPTADTLMLILMVANRYHPFPNSPHSSTLASDAQKATSTHSHSLTYQHTLENSPVGSDSEEHSCSSDNLKKSLGGSTMKESVRQMLNVEFDVMKSGDQKYFEWNVFLGLYKETYVPHTLHCIEVYPSIVLALISETLGCGLGELMSQFATITQQILDTSSGYSREESFEKLEKTIRDIVDVGKTEAERLSNPNVYRQKMTLASHLSELISKVMVHLLHMVSERGIYLTAESFDTLEENIRNLVKAGKTEAKRFSRPNLKRRMVKLSKIWGSFCEYGAMMAGPAGEDMWQTKVFGEARNIFEHLKALFMELYSFKNRKFDVEVTASVLKQHCLRLTRDYGDYLATKAAVNLPLVGFVAAYPGMVHFMYVDRSFDELISPSIVDDYMSISHVAHLAEECGKTLSDFLREKVWAMVQRAQKYLALGYTSQTWMDTEFQYTYCMWISMLNPTLENHHRLVPAVNVRAPEGEPLGVLSGNFYRNISGDFETSSSCTLELYCIHEPNISLETATLQCKNLAYQLWLNTLTPFPIINYV